MALSACNRGDIAARVAEMSETLCDEGAVSIIEGYRPGVELEQFAGFCMDVQADRAGVSVKEQGARIEMDGVHVLVVNEILDDFGPLARVMEQFVSRAKSLVVVARGIQGAARATLAANRAGPPRPHPTSRIRSFVRGLTDLRAAKCGAKSSLRLWLAAHPIGFRPRNR